MNKFLLLCCLCLPLRHIQVTSSYGYRVHPITGKYSFHAGIDLRARSDTVFAVLPGKVVAAGFDPLLGVYLRLAHGDFQTIYGHLSQIFVMSADSVSAADCLGITGSTGRVTGEHLHFAVQYRRQYIDPLRFLLIIENNINPNKKEKNHEYPLQTPVRTDR
jgi:murein DD-endopeptidase MepM/ murein hydrolase activator NlpD